MTTNLSTPVTEDDIANYLASTPDFFERHAELLASVVLASPHSARAVSLQERQAQLLREKIKVAEHRLMELVRNGNDNLLRYDKLLGWASALFRVSDPLNLPQQIAAEIETRFSVPQVAIKVWAVAPAFAAAEFSQGVSDDARSFASSLLEPFCGVNSGFEVVNWLPEPQAASSLAILPLRDGELGSASPAYGLLVLASPDAQRFNSTMATDFLARIAELASAALQPLRARTRDSELP